MINAPEFEVIYSGTNITADLAPYLLSVDIEDVLEGESDTLSVLLADDDHRWMDAWMPQESDVITASLGATNRGGMIGPISFEVDEVVWRANPRTFELRAVATPISQKLRQRNTIAYENTTLQAIAVTIAARHGLRVSGDVPAIRFERVTQQDTTDLAFLRELAAEYGVIFKIDSLTTLVFFQEADLEVQESVLALEPEDFNTYSVTRSSTETYSKAEVSYQGADREFISVTVGLDGVEVPKPKEEGEGAIGREDTLRISKRVESLAIAKTEAVAALNRANRARLTLSGSLAEGDARVAAGVVISLDVGFFRLSGSYLVTRANHGLSPAYSTRFEARKIG